MGDLNEMKQAAEAGKWAELKRLALASLECQYPMHQLAHDHAFEQAAQPGVIWRLIEKYEALIAENERLKADVKDALGEKTLADQAVIEIAAARDQLKAGNEALQRDAERYRWLRSLSPYPEGYDQQVDMGIRREEHKLSQTSRGKAQHD